MAQSFTKDPASSRTFGIDWRELLPAGVTLSAVTWSVPTGLLSVAQQVSGSKGLIRLSGGVLNTTYEVIATATWSDGQTDVRRIFITIKPL